MNRRNFLLKFFLWVLSIVFGYKVGYSSGENKEETIIITKNEKSILSRLDLLNEQVQQNTQQLQTANELILSLKDERFGAKGNADYYNTANGRWYADAAFTTLANDDTAALKKAIEYAVSQLLTMPELSTNPVSNVMIDIPPGNYLIMGSDLLKNVPVRFYGLCFKGRGRGLSRMIYSPEKRNSYLFYNDDKVLGLNFEDLAFFGTPDSNFLCSVSHGGPQSYLFHKVSWKNFNKVLDLQGTNNNSEHSFSYCGFSGVIKKAFYIGEDNTSDQFLNYNFFSCNFEVSEGNFIDIARGGNINVWGGSFIHTGSEKAGTFFKLNGNSHARGVQRLLVSGIRVEHRGIKKSKLIECGWGWGNIDFISCDMIANEDGNSDEIIRASFDAGNESMPAIQFRSCQLAGKHEFAFAANSWEYPHNVEYHFCFLPVIRKGMNIDAFIAYKGSVNPGGKAAITFEECRTSDKNFVINSNYNALSVTKGILKKRVYALKTASGEFPHSGEEIEITFPLGSMITKIELYIPEGAMKSSRPAEYKIQTKEGSRAALLDTAGTKVRLSELTDITIPLRFVCDTIDKTKWTFSADRQVNETTNKAYCLIEYLG